MCQTISSSGAARRQQGAKKAKFCQPDLLIHVDSSVDLSFLLRLRSKQSNVEQLRLTSALICRGNQINTKWNWYIDVHGFIHVLWHAWCFLVLGCITWEDSNLWMIKQPPMNSQILWISHLGWSRVLKADVTPQFDPVWLSLRPPMKSKWHWHRVTPSDTKWGVQGEVEIGPIGWGYGGDLWRKTSTPEELVPCHSMQVPALWDQIPLERPW